MEHDLRALHVLLESYSDDDLADRLNETQLRLDALDQIEREQFEGLDFGQRAEYKMLRTAEAQMRAETSRRRADANAAKAVVVANEFHAEHPDLLVLMRMQDPVALVKVVYDMSDDDLKLIKSHVRLLEVLADKVLLSREDAYHREVAERAVERDFETEEG